MTTPSPRNEESHLLDYLIVMAKYSRMIIYTSIAATILTYVILFILPNKYTAKGRIVPPQQNMTLSAQLMDIVSGGVSPGKGLRESLSLASMAEGMFSLMTPADFYAAIMTGDTVLDRIIERFDLKKIYKERYFEDARRILKKKASIKASKKDGLITIEVTDTDPQRAAAITNAFGEELDRLLQELAVKEAEERLSFLEKQRALTTNQLTKAEEALRTFSEQKNVIQIDAQTRGMLEYIATLRGFIDAKEVQIKVMQQQATPLNYDLIRLDTEVKGLKEKLRAAETQYDQSSKGDFCIPPSKAPSLGLEFIRLYRDVKYQETLYVLFTKMVEIARLDTVKNVTVLHIVDKAGPPERRSNKRLLPACVTGIVLFFIMIFVAFTREHWQKNIAIQEAEQLSILVGYLDPWRNIIRSFQSIFRKK